MESERMVRLAPGHLVRVKRTGALGVVAWVDRDRLEEPWVMLGVWVMERAGEDGAQLVRRRFPAVDVEAADPDTLAVVVVQGELADKRFEWDVGSGDPVRFVATGEVGVVADVGPGSAVVWVLEWAGRAVPRLVRRQCDAEGVRLAPIAVNVLEPEAPAVPKPTLRCDALVIDALGRVARWRPVDCPVKFSMSGPPQSRECAPVGCRHHFDSGQQVNCMATCQRAVNYNTLLWCQYLNGRGAMELLGRVLYDEREARDRIEADFDAVGQVAVGVTDEGLRHMIGTELRGDAPKASEGKAPYVATFATELRSLRVGGGVRPLWACQMEEAQRAKAAKPVDQLPTGEEAPVVSPDKLVSALVVTRDGRVRRFEPQPSVVQGHKPIVSLRDVPCKVGVGMDWCTVRCSRLQRRGDAGLVVCQVTGAEGRIVEDDLRDWAAPQVTMEDYGRVPADPKPLRVQALWIDARGEVQREPSGGGRRSLSTRYLPCPVGVLQGVLKRPACTATCPHAHRVPLLPRGGLLRCDAYLTGQLLGRILEDAVGLGWKDGVEPDAAGLVPIDDGGVAP